MKNDLPSPVPAAPVVLKLEVNGQSYEIVLPHAEADYIQKGLVEKGVPYEQDMLRDIASRVQPGELVLDIGANIGNHALYLAAIGGCEVEAFEPNAQLCEALRESVRRNDFGQRLHVHQLGLGRTEGVAEFAGYLPDNLGAQQLALGAGTLVVKPLDGFAFARPVRAMKIDVEGMELDVLEGGRQLIARDRPILYIECATESHFLTILHCVEGLGYTHWDTFNATPTHLFLPAETVTTERRLHQLQVKAVQQDYRTSVELRRTRKQLDEANARYRQASEQIAALKQKVATAEAGAHDLKSRLDEANARYRQAGEQVAALKQRSATAEAHLQQAQQAGVRQAAQIEQLTHSLLETKQKLDKQSWELGRARQATQAAEAQVAKTRAMLSFQLGYTLLHGTKSVKGLVQMPGKLLALRKQSAQRKPKPAVLELPAQPVADVQGQPPQLAPHVLDLPALRDADPAKALQALKALRVAAIMDEFTFASYAPECNLMQLSVDGWQGELEAFAPQLVFIESAWRGKDDRWGSKVGHLSAEVVGIVQWCRAHGVPTVFWNKEDPVHFETFLNTAKHFEYVFTTDIDCIHRYKAALGHDRVYLLPFACQPTVNHPIEKYPRKDAFCFAGAYYVRYPDRTRDLGNFMTSLAQHRPVEIYDRNFGKDDPNYQFPPEYRPFIVGNLPFHEIDKAYKGYRYAINLNSIKQSQSMFARRVFELLASNTITVSNFSRGVRLLFGDLVITSDDGAEILQRIRGLGDGAALRKFRLAGLRKVMQGHTYLDRFAYVVAKAQGGHAPPQVLPRVLVTALAQDQRQFDAIVAAFSRQHYAQAELALVTAAGFTPAQAPADARVRVLAQSAIENGTLAQLAGDTPWIAPMVADDHYGANYLTDLALATRYSQAAIIGKAAHHAWSVGGVTLVDAEAAYTPVDGLPARCALVRRTLVDTVSASDWLASLPERHLQGDALAIDEFNYCRGVGPGGLAADGAACVDDLQGLDAGLPAAALAARAERIGPQQQVAQDAPMLTGEQLAGYFKPPANRGYQFQVDGSGWEVSSTLADGKHEYVYANKDVRPADLGFAGQAAFHLEATPGLNLQVVVQFLDAQKQRISHAQKSVNLNATAQVPVGTEWIRLGLRVYGAGSARIHSLVLGHRQLRPAEVLGRSRHLVLTNHYPSYDDLYRNGFVHTRVAAYAARGTRTDVFRLRRDAALSYHEFHDVDVITGSQEALHKLLAGGDYQSVLVHFLDEPMWEVLKHHIDRVKVIVWVHGAEFQPWHRREFNLEGEDQLHAAKQQSEERMRFWQGLLRDMPANLQLVFVSQYFAGEAMEDLGFRLPEDKYHVIHNPIDTRLFAYHPKHPEHRKKILSIRTYASRKYANDLTVDAILALKSQPWFDELEFRLIGDGKLFDEVLAPVRGLDNVLIERRFLTQPEIAALQRDYGIFLTPTRWDSQGVSRDEAMASGLVPVTNAVSGVPEFVDASCAITAPAEDAAGLAAGIAQLVEDPQRFLAMSRAASERVRAQSASDAMVERELGLFAGPAA